LIFWFIWLSNSILIFALAKIFCFRRKKRAWSYLLFCKFGFWSSQISATVVQWKVTWSTQVEKITPLFREYPYVSFMWGFHNNPLKSLYPWSSLFIPPYPWTRIPNPGTVRSNRTRGTSKINRLHIFNRYQIWSLLPYSLIYRDLGWTLQSTPDSISKTLLIDADRRNHYMDSIELAELDKFLEMLKENSRTLKM
jgi:hypothetical protein